MLMRIGSESERDEGKQSFQHPKNLPGKLRDAMPVSTRDAEAVPEAPFVPLNVSSERR